jgi:phosphoglycolate phosphatase
MFRITSTKMLICDMAGTTIQEKGIVYNSLYKTIRLVYPELKKEDIKEFGGAKKREVIKYFVNKRKMDSPEVVINNLDSEFNYFLKKEYQENPSVKLIDPNLPNFFNALRDQNIKIQDIIKKYKNY